MTKIAYNACFGGFGLSHVAVMRYAELKGLKIYPFIDRRLPDGSRPPFNAPDRYVPATDEEALKAFMVHYCTTPEYSEDSYWFERFDSSRDDPALIQVIEELGDKANGDCARLRIAEIPAGTQYRIDEYDGRESVETRDSYDWKVA